MRKNLLAKRVLCSVLAASVFGVTGNVFAAIHDDQWIVNGQIIENVVTEVVTGPGYSMEDLKAGAIITDSKFLNNKFTGTAVYGGVFRVMNTLNPKQIVNLKDVVFDGNISSVNKNNTWACGGAVMIKGSTTVFEDVDFDNNKIIGEGDAVQVSGGAVYVDAVKNKDVVKPEGNANVTFKVTKDVSYTGNTVVSGDNGGNWYDTYGGLAQSKGGFLFIDRDAVVDFDINENATLTIGEKNSIDKNADTIASVIPHQGSGTDFAGINKKGAGTLTINSSLNDYYGIINVNEGTLNVDKSWNAKNSIKVAQNAIANFNNLELSKIEGTVNSYNSSINGKKDYTFVSATGSITAEGEVNISDGLNMHEGTTAALNGGGTVSAAAGHNSAVHADKATFTSTDVDFNGEISAKNGAAITINGGTVNAIDYYYEDGKVDGKTEVNAQGSGSNVTLKNVQINSHVSAYGGGVVNVNNSNINGYEGLEAFKGGVINLNGSADNTYVAQEYIFVGDENSKIYLNGGTLVAENLRDLLQVDFDGAIQSSADKGIVLDQNGVIETKADQIFANGVDLTSDETVLTSEAGAVTNKAIDYKGGTLSLTDEKYSLGYVQSAKNSLTEHDNDSKTSIVMTGDLVTENGTNNISVSDAASVGDDIALDKVTVEADKNLLVGSASASGTVEGIKVEDTVANGFNAGSLNLAADSTGMVITNDKNVTLGGSEGGSIITVTGNESAAVEVVVGTNTLVDGTTSKTGSFTIGNALATSATEYTLNGSVTVNADSNLTTNGQTKITNGVILNGGNLDAASGVLDLTGENNGITATGNSTITGTVNVGKLTADNVIVALDNSANTTVINMGNSDKAANVVVTEADLNGATVFLDPAWKDDNEITDASKMAVKDTAVDGKYVVGQNSVLSFGVDNTAEAQEVFAKTGLTWGEDDTTAALYIADIVDLTSGSVVVNGSLTDAPKDSISNGTFKVAANSVTMIDGSKFNDTTGEFAITNVASAEIAQNTEGETDGAKLFIDNAKKGETYNVISGTGVGTAADASWSTDNIDFDNTLLVVDEANTKVENNTFVVGAKYQTVDQAYGEGAVVIAGVVDKTLEVGKEGNAAYDFFNAAASENGSEAGAVAAFNSAANMGEMGGVNHAAYSVSNAMTDAVADHLSIATHGDQDKDIWAHYVHNKENIEGISLGGINADYDLQYNGIVVGSDLYKKGKATAGIALSYIEGDVTNSNIASNTKNEAEYYGASVYGRIDNGNSAVLGDITYMHGSSDITQQNSGYKLTADADTDVFSIGVRAEQKVEAGIGHFVPYAGLRYMHIGTGNYTNSIGMSYDVDEQNLWLLPVGVTYSCEAQKGDWTIRPVVEAGYVWAMGDRDTNQTVSLNGAANGFGFDTTDSGSFISRFAVEAEKANVVYSLGYEYQKGDTVKANKWMANMTFTF